MSQAHSGPDPTIPDIDALLTDQGDRWRAGECVTVEAYLESHPGLRDHAESLLDLIYHEVMLRERLGESPGPDEYALRFPWLAVALRDQFEIHRAFGGGTTAPGATMTTGAYDPVPTEVLLPSRIGPFEVIAPIGRGGMGRVLKAYDHALGRYVAIKLLSPELAADPMARQRFAREARAAAAVVHEHVVTIHAVDQTEGQPYLVMPYIAGGSLQQRLDAGGPVPVAEAVRIARETALGLAAAHALGLIHRDVKPANILLEQGTGCVKLVDFGLARAVGAVGLTHSGAVAGTPAYMAPEQARNEALDHRADLFSLGSVLYAMLSGHPPFTSESVYSLLLEIGRGRTPSLRAEGRDVPAWLVAVVDRLHAADPADRFPSAADAAAALDREVQDGNVPAATGRPEPVGTGRRGRRVGMAFLSVASLAAAAAFVATRSDRSVPQLRDPARAAPPPSPAPTPAKSAARMLYDEAEEAMGRDALAVARTKLEASLVLHRDPLAALALRACVRRLQSRPHKFDAEAERADCTKALQYDHEAFWPYLFRSYDGIRLGDLDQGLADAEHAARINPKNYIPFNLLGWGYQLKGEHEKAVVAFSQSIALAPRWHSNYAQRCDSYRKLGDLEHALADLATVFRLAPPHADNYLRRARIELDRKRYAAALSDFDTALLLDPNSDWPRTERAAAVTRIRTQLETLPPGARARLLYDLAAVALGRDDCSAARPDLESSLALQREPLAEIALRVCLRRIEAPPGKRDLDAECADCTEAIEHDPDAFWPYLFRSGDYILKGDLDRGLADADRAVQINPDSYIAHNHRGWGYQAKGAHAEAVDSLSKSIALAPRWPSNYGERAASYRALGDLPHCLADLTEAIRVSPQWADFYVERAGAYRALKQYDEALADLDAALRLQPKRAELYTQRAYLYEQKGNAEQERSDREEAERLMGRP